MIRLWVGNSYKDKPREQSDNDFANYAEMLGMSSAEAESQGGLDSTAGGFGGFCMVGGFDGLFECTWLTISDGRSNCNRNKM